MPVYAGFEETLWSIESVLGTTAPDRVELVVINDASPDSELTAALEGLADRGRITLLVNPWNLGFPGSVNRGIALHPERDVVVLNADTAVSGDWLERLRCAASRDDDIGTVTPLGGCASIMSYPSAKEGVETPAEAAEIDGIARRVNAGKIVELPVGVGFCLYIRRRCLSDAGALDEEAFGKGYGEENDFCLRARELGWRHVGAMDVYVGHRGARSFRRTKQALSERNGRVLNLLHPGYDATIARFTAADPLLAARRTIDVERLLSDIRNPVLLVTLDLPGGVSRHVDERRDELRAAGHSVLVLRPAVAQRTVLSSPDHRLENLRWNLPEETRELASFLARAGLTRIELHHFFGLQPAALELIAGLGVPYDVFIHDYSWICPRVTLVGGNGAYCGEPAIEECETCIRTHGSELEDGLTVSDLRRRSARILGGAARVTVPTEDAANRLARYFPDLAIRVTGWEASIAPPPHPAAPPAERIRVAVIGRIGLQKGYRVLLDCARDAARRDLDIEFVVIGYTMDDEALLDTGRVWITGSYTDGEIDALLERERCHAALFPSVSPETWCYALSHAIRRGLPVSAFDMGAIRERLRGYAAADLLPLSATPDGINDSLVRLARKGSASGAQKELAMTNTPPLDEPPVSKELESTVKVLTLPAGVYAFTVRDGAADLTSGELAVPALQVGLAPVRSPGSVEFLAGAATLDRWLTRAVDTIIVRITGGEASLLLTSIRWPASPALAINIQRLETEPRAITAELMERTGAATAALPVRILAHIRNFGDVQFNDGWAGFIGSKLCIEAFDVTSIGNAGADPIEYRGLMADGFETPWLSNQTLCGSRGRGMPLTGFAVRVKAAAAEHYECAYTGRFLSGATVGPLRDGSICCSDAPGDPLEGIDVQVVAVHSRAYGAGPGGPV